jgi:hypothetical protein
MELLVLQAAERLIESKIANDIKGSEVTRQILVWS